MAHRLRAHSRQAASSSSTSNQGPGKRKRDIVQGSSEEHSSHGSSKPASTSSSGRRASGHRRPSPTVPMAPARRGSVRVRRSRRLSEQQSTASGKNGGVTGTAAASGANGDAIGRSGMNSGVTSGSMEEDEGGMSCDEDLEGTVVDLSFEGVADDSEWREPDGQTAATASVSGASSSSGETREANGGKSTSGDEERSIDAEGNHSLRHSINNNAGNTNSSETHPGPATRRARARERAGNAAGAAAIETCATSAPSSALGDINCDRHGRTGADGTRQDQQTSKASGSSSTISGGSSAKSLITGEPVKGIGGDGGRVHEQQSVAPSVAADTVTRTPLPVGVEDIDAGAWDSEESHLQNPDYAVEHAAFLRTQERRNRPAAYIGMRQKDMRQSMRSVLVDWIVEVCDQFKLSSRTLFQVVELIDRSLSAFEVSRGKLQLLGCACVVLAAKYEEIYVPTAEELAHISDNTYTRGEIISMELVVLNALQFRLTCITPCCFVDRFCRAARSNARERSLVAYLLELLLQDYQGVALLPSLKAAAALYLARQTLHPKGCPREAWTRQTEYYTGYTARALEPCVRRLHALHVRAEGHNLHAVRDKYKRPQLHRVAELTCALEDALDFGDEE